MAGHSQSQPRFLLNLFSHKTIYLWTGPRLEPNSCSTPHHHTTTPTSLCGWDSSWNDNAVFLPCLLVSTPEQCSGRGGRDAVTICFSPDITSVRIHPHLAIILILENKHPDIWGSRLTVYYLLWYNSCPLQYTVPYVVGLIGPTRQPLYTSIEWVSWLFCRSNSFIISLLKVCVLGDFMGIFLDTKQLCVYWVTYLCRLGDVRCMKLATQFYHLIDWDSLPCHVRSCIVFLCLITFLLWYKIDITILFLWR